VVLVNGTHASYTNETPAFLPATPVTAVTSKVPAAAPTADNPALVIKAAYVAMQQDPPSRPGPPVILASSVAGDVIAKSFPFGYAYIPKGTVAD